MKLITLSFLLLLGTWANAQRTLNPKSRKQAFGKRDIRDLSKHGLQFQLGPTFTKGLDRNQAFDMDPAVTHGAGTYAYNPSGLMGFYAEVGMMHFPTKRSKLSKALNTVLVSYYDWGVGYKHLGGAEEITRSFANGVTRTDKGQFYHGHVFGRFTAYKSFHIGKERFFYIDFGLGVNFDYKLVHGNTSYSGELVPGQRTFYNPLLVQLHSSLGLGFRLKRGVYLTPGVRTPILGYQSVGSSVDAKGKSSDANAYFGNPSLQWFSSKYWPIYPHIKLTFLLEKKVKGCKGADINSQDRETQRSR